MPDDPTTPGPTLDPTHPPPASGGADLQSQFDAMRRQLDDANATITRLERRQRIDQLLAEADAIDLDAGRLLTEAALSTMEQPDVKLAIDDLRRVKPWLFRQSSGTSLANSGAAAAMPANIRGRRDAANPLQTAHAQAATGTRRDLLHYLRLRQRQRA
ncbi:MAG: hypothetical protein WD042_05750 [Phycisphaeraceae bacterium]